MGRCLPLMATFSGLTDALAKASDTQEQPVGERALVSGLPTAQFLEQGLRLFQIDGIEAFGEPVVDLAEHHAGFLVAS